MSFERKTFLEILNLFSKCHFTHLLINSFIVLRTFEASGEQAEKNEIEMEEKIAVLQREGDENTRLLEQTQSENSNLKKLLEEMERDFDKMKMERDESKQELQAMMQEIGDIA